MFTEYSILFLLTLISYYILSQRRPKKFPPGPPSLPFYGNLTQLGTKGYETLKNWKVTYGSVVGIYLGSIRAVAISDTKLIKEALSDPNFAGRGYFPGVIQIRDNGERGIVFSNGKTWHEQRRFTLKTLRNFGFGKKSMECMIHEELRELIIYFRNHCNELISTRNKFNAAIINALWNIIYGERFKQDDPQLIKIISLLTEAVDKQTMNQVLVFHPKLNKIAPKLTGLSSMIQDFKPIVNFIKEKYFEHSKTYIEGEPRDFIDVFADEVKKTKDPKSSFYGKPGELQIIFTIFDLFGAGSETTSSTIQWLILYLTLYPEIQEKFRNEIFSVVGNSRLPSLDDKPNMPYCESVIWETLRFSSLVPLGVFRATLADVEFHNYFIPKNTMIIPNLWAVHFDKEIWGDPHNFRPERFLSDDGKSFVKNDNLLAFGSGKRKCIGESLAKEELFLITTGIFQNFKISYDPLNKPSLEPHVGIDLVPKEHKLIFTEIN